MALRLRRDVQKASYYVWFLGAEEAKGLRGSRVINSVLPYLIDRSRDQEPLKVTLQVSHKGIKILQGSSKHFIPHSAITSSVQTDDIVACVLLLYNPATKCPLHVHAYRCDSETTAEALHQQLQILINRPENQKRFEELESRLNILQMPPPQGSNKLSSSSSAHTSEHGQKHFQTQHRRLETSPKRFSSSLGSDTGNSTRESECSEEQNVSPMSRSPPMIKQNNDLFDSLAAELRAKLNGNGPPLLLPPRDYDTVHRSKGNLAAIELRRCRNSLIVGNTKTSPIAAAGGPISNGAPVKQVSSRGSSGIGSDLAPSPERQDLHSSSDDEHWSNEADNSVIALKPSQIAIERSAPMKQQHQQLNRKSAVQPPEDNYLRDLPTKPYLAAQGIGRSSSHSREKEKMMIVSNSEGDRSKTLASVTSSSSSRNREDEIKPIIMRPSDYDAKFNRVLMDRSEKHRPVVEDRRHFPGGKIIDAMPQSQHGKLHDTDKYNEINRSLNRKLSLEPDSPNNYHHHHKMADEFGEYDDSDGEQVSMHATVSKQTSYHKDNLTDKQKFQEYSSKKTKAYPDPDPHRFGTRQRYVDPTDLPFEQPTQVHHKKYAPASHSPERDIHRESLDRDRGRQHEGEGTNSNRRQNRGREYYSHSNERNPYREPESIPYIESMERMMKSSAMRYKSYDNSGSGVVESNNKEEAHSKVILRKSYSKSEKPAGPSATTHHPHHNEELKVEKEFGYTRSQQQQHRSDYTDSSNGNNSPKDRFKDAKEKFRAMERSGSRYSVEDKEATSQAQYAPRSLQRRPSLEPADTLTRSEYNDWSDEEETGGRSRSRTRNHWEQTREMTREMPREITREIHSRDYQREHIPREQHVSRELPRDHREYRDVRTSRDLSEVRNDNREHRDPQNVNKNHQRDHPRDYPRDHNRDHLPRDYPRDSRCDNRNFASRPIDKRGPQPVEMHSTPNAALSNSKSLSNLTKGYRHSYAEPVFARTGGRVGLAAVNPF